MKRNPFLEGTFVWYRGEMYEVVEYTESQGQRYIILGVEVPPPLGYLQLGVAESEWSSLTVDRMGEPV